MQWIGQCGMHHAPGQSFKAGSALSIKTRNAASGALGVDAVSIVRQALSLGALGLAQKEIRAACQDYADPLYLTVYLGGMIMLSHVSVAVKQNVNIRSIISVAKFLTSSRLLVIVWFLLATTLAVLAQSTQVGHLSGKLADPAGEPLPGATVIIEGERLFNPRSVVSDDEGKFAFRHLPVGSYTVTAILEGFQTLKAKDVRISLGFTSEFHWRLALKDIQDQIVVTAETPLIDASSANIGKNFKVEELEKTSVSKDPWGVINMVPGVNLSRNDVGGNQAGTQARFAGPGVNQFQNAYYIDGVNITDTAATGASSQYFDFSRFEEWQISTGAHDPSVQSAGVILNMVSRSGSNTYRGNLDFFYQNEDLQGSNPITVDGQTREIGTPSHFNRDMAASFSGPIVKDRLWFAANAHNNRIDNYTDTTRTARDFTELEQWSFKVEGALGQNQRLTASYAFDEKGKPNRNGSVLRGPVATWNQNGPGHKESLGHEWFINENMILETKIGFSKAPFALAPQAEVDLSTPTIFDDNIPDGGNADGVYPFTNGNDYYFDNLRKRKQYGTKLTFFQDDWLGADHTMMIGVDASRSDNSAARFMPGDAVIVINSLEDQADLGTGQIWLSRSATTAERIETQSLYFNDTVETGKWTFNLGFRYDRQRGSVKGGRVEAPQWFDPDFAHARFFEALEAEDAEDVADWENLLPRLSATYDLKGDGRSVLKASYSQYAYVLDSNVFAQRSPVAFTEIDYVWEDLNGDGQWSLDETQTDQVTFATGVTLGGTPVDERLKAPTIAEAMLTYDQAFSVNGSDLALSASFIHKVAEDEVYLRDRNRALANWTRGDVERVVNGETFRFEDVYIFNGDTLPDNIIANYSGQERTYNGFLMSLTKPYGQDKWSAAFSLAYNDTQNDFNVTELDNPNTIFAAKGSSDAGVYASRWTGKLNLAYQLPWDLHASMFVRHDSGQTYDTTALIPTGGVNTAFFVNTESFPSLTQIDLGLQKAINLGGRYELNLRLDAFNATNENTVIGYTSFSRTSSRFQSPSTILAPRIVRAGASLRF